MQLIVTVYNALRSFSRPCTRAEIERESCLCTVGVKKGLAGLKRRGDLQVTGSPRQRALYALRPGALAPVDERGRYDRSIEHRQRQRSFWEYPGARPVRYLASRPPSHQAMPGAARLVSHGMGLAGTKQDIAPCALAQFWRKR